MIFKHSLLKKIEVSTVQTDRGRFYETPIGRLRSVTTIIGESFGTKELDEWRSRIGVDAANQISEQARNRGTAVHKIFEDYINLKPDWRKGVMPVNLEMFLRIKPLLDNGLTTIYGIEHKLFSEKLRAAGTADLIAEWNNKFNAVTDFKTARKKLPETDNRLLKYRLQATAYSMMIEEQHQLKMPYNVIIILADGEKEAQIDITANKRFRSQVLKIFRGDNNESTKLPI